MSYSQSGKKQGFTLLEIIVVLVILSIVAVGFSDTIFYGVRNYFFSREANQLAQKAQLALARINKELVDAKSISDADMSSVQYKQAKGDEYRIELSENAVNMRGINPQMDARPLIDGLAENNGGKNFLTYYKTGGGAWSPETDSINDLALIKVNIVLAFSGTDDLSFETSIAPRPLPVLPKIND
jgi:prepilin-type N-terminal cleavage/methylation domain-containing protein